MARLRDEIWKDIVSGEGRLSGPLGELSVYTEGEPACSDACPAGVDVKAYINLIADRRFEEAIAVVRRANPFPAVCGRVCTHPCEASCGRKDIDDALAIRALKRFASDYEMSRRSPIEPVMVKHEEKVAVIGAGPAGLTAALTLAYEGYAVKVYDSEPVAGGIMARGIPDFRLPKDIIRSEVREIVSAGVDVILNTEVDDPRALLTQGYSAVILATGCRIPVGLAFTNDKIVDCLDFLKDSIIGEKKPISGKVLVIGGGSAALDSARTAVRMGADVTVVYRRTREEMPVDQHEIKEAEEEGVRFEYLAIPADIELDGSALKSMQCQRTKLGEPDESGRRRPEPVPGEFFNLEADWIITAIGSKPDTSYFNSHGLDTTTRGALKVDDKGHTSIDGLFAAGDAVMGPSSIIDAIGSAHVASRGVMDHLGRNIYQETKQRPMLVIETPIEGDRPRVATRTLQAETRRTTFDEVEVGYDEVTALAEASRCRRCGTCSVCDVCLGTCEHAQVVLVDKEGSAILVKAPREITSALNDAPEKGNGWTLIANGQSVDVMMMTITAKVEPEKCISCGLCDDVCVYRAVRIKFQKGQGSTAVVDPSACRSCGACAAVCPTGAISQGYMDDEDLLETPGSHTLFSCIWRNGEGLGSEVGTVNLTCTRRLSPYLALRTLASGTGKITVAGCGEGDCHYLPGPWMGADVVDAVRAILEEAGTDQSIIDYVKTDRDSKELLAGSTAITVDDQTKTEPVGQLGKALALAYGIAGSQPPMKKARITSTVLESYGLESLAPMLDSAETLAEIVNPEFRQTDLRVAVHSCSQSLVDNLSELLAKMPGIDILEVNDSCGQTSWDKADAHGRKAAIELLEKAAAGGASLLLTDSADCLSHLKTVTRAWNESSVEISDIYSFILSRLKGGD